MIYFYTGLRKVYKISALIICIVKSVILFGLLSSLKKDVKINCKRTVSGISAVVSIVEIILSGGLPINNDTYGAGLVL